MNLSFMADHKALPPWVAGKTYESRITKVKPSVTGFTLYFSFIGAAGLGVKHFYLVGESPQALQIGRDELSSLFAQTGVKTNSEELLGCVVKIRTSFQNDSDLPKISVVSDDVETAEAF